MDIFKTKIVHEAIEGFIVFFLKWWVVGSYIMMAIITKFSFDRSRGVRLSFWETLGGIGVAWCMGAWAAIICANREWNDQMYWVVPLATLLGDKIYLYIMSNWKVILYSIVKAFKLIPDTKELEDEDKKKNIDA